MERKKTYSLKAKLASGMLLLAFIAGVHTSYAQQNSSGSSFRVFAEDTIAGYGSSLTTSSISAGAQVAFSLKKPQGSTIALEAKADERGVATVDVTSYHTQQAGMYHVEAFVANQKTETTFQVFADKPAETLSTLTLTKKMAAANGKDFATVTVTLKDGFGNPVEKHKIALVSSRPEDVIVLASESAETIVDGTVQFKVASTKEGLATLTAMDMTTNAVVGGRETVLFANDVTSSGVNPTNLQSSLLAQTNTTTSLSEAARLRVQTDPATRVAVGDYYNVTVEVLDQNGQPATDYRGTILFTSTDVNAELPLKTTGYTFTGAEQPAGTKVFSQAARFLSAGEKTVEIVDRDNINLTTSYRLTAFDRAGGTTTSTTPIVITRPQAGILTTNSVTVEGTGTAYQELHIYDNGVDVETVTADAQGVFTAQLTDLTDGTHKIEVKAQDAGGNISATSDAVTVSLRSSTPTVQSLTYDPAGSTFSPEQQVKVIVTAEAGASRVIYSIAGNPYQLAANPQVTGQYEAQVTLPAQLGTYDVTVQVENSFGVTGEQEYPGSVVIAQNFNLNAVQYEAVSPTSLRVTWQEPTSSGFRYRLKYGANAGQLTQTKDITGTSPFTLDGLVGNTTYYVQFQVLDAAGTQVQQSDPKAVTTPQALAITNARADTTEEGKLRVQWSLGGPVSQVTGYRVLYGISPETYTKEQTAVASATEITLEPLADKTLHYVRIQALGQNNAPLVQSSEFTGIPQILKSAAPTTCQPADVQNLRVVIINELKYLEWDAVPLSEGYKVYMGSSEGNYTTQLSVTENRYAIPDLDTAKAQYYFAVTSLCDGKESLSLSKAIKVESGPLFWALSALLLALIGAGVHVFRRQIRVI